MVLVMPAAPVEIMDRPFTRADLARLPNDGRRYEIIDGERLPPGGRRPG